MHYHDLLWGDWKRGSGKCGSSKNAGVEIAGVEIAAPNCRGGNRGSGNRGTRMQGWKSREWKSRHQSAGVVIAPAFSAFPLLWAKTKEANSWPTRRVTELALEIDDGWRTGFAYVTLSLQLINSTFFEVLYCWLARGSPVSSVTRQRFELRRFDAALVFGTCLYMFLSLSSFSKAHIACGTAPNVLIWRWHRVHLSQPFKSCQYNSVPLH